MMILTRSTVVIVLAMFQVLVKADDQHIVLPPVTTDPQLPEKMLLFIPGGKVPNENYAATAAAIQKAATGLRLWVTIPAVFQRLCIITCSATSICSPFHATVEVALGQAVDKGWKRGKDDEDIFLAGHSLGGVCANTLFQAYSVPDEKKVPYAALLVFGSYVDETGPYDALHYPVPLLTLNVELDGGLARPGKTAVWWRQHELMTRDQGEAAAIAKKPVIVLPKLNHSDFCPGFDVPGDLVAEVDQATATQQIAEVAAAFLHTLRAEPLPGALDVIKERVSWTRQLLTPYLKAQDMELSASLTNVSAEGASPFCAEAQHIVAGLAKTDDRKLTVMDGFHASSPNLEHCHPNWTLTDDHLQVHCCSHTDYYPDVANTGSISAASEIACKLLSSDRIAAQLGVKAAEPNVDCRAGNRRAVEIAENLAAPSTLERFRKSGRGWCFEEDVATLGNVGPLWVFKDKLNLKETPKCMSVSSPVLKTGLDSKIYPGNHYCKFLSPARVLDWMMTDGLKKMKNALETSAPIVV